MYYVDHLITANTLLKQMYEQAEEKNFLDAYKTGIQLSGEILEALKDINRTNLNNTKYQDAKRYLTKKTYES